MSDTHAIHVVRLNIDDFGESRFENLTMPMLQKSSRRARPVAWRSSLESGPRMRALASVLLGCRRRRNLVPRAEIVLARGGQCGSAAVLLKEQARRRAVSFAGPLLDKADRG
jgi:hypothetical protein